MSAELVSKAKAAFCAAFATLPARWFLLCWAQVKVLGFFIQNSSGGVSTIGVMRRKREKPGLWAKSLKIRSCSPRRVISQALRRDAKRGGEKRGQNGKMQNLCANGIA